MELPTIKCTTEQDLIELNAAVNERFERHVHAIPDWSLIKDLAARVGAENLKAFVVGFLRDLPEGAQSLRKPEVEG